MNRLRQLADLITYLGVINFALFIVILLLLGGDGLNGKVEAGHYYLGNHGVYTEVPYFLYLYSRIHGISVFVSWPAVMLAALVSLPGFQPRSEVIDLGRIYGMVEGIFWRLFDSWRSPDSEFFTRKSRGEWRKALEAALQQETEGLLQSKSVNVYAGGDHFEAGHRRSLLVVHGKLNATPHGIYVRVWHRLSVFALLFLTAFFAGGLIGTLIILPLWAFAFLVLGMDAFSAYEAVRPIIQARIFSVLTIFGGMLALIGLGARVGRRINGHLVSLLKDTLTDRQGKTHELSGAASNASLIQRLRGK